MPIAWPGASRVSVIPAKAGIHFARHHKHAGDEPDSCFRGNDRHFEGDSQMTLLPNARSFASVQV